MSILDILAKGYDVTPYQHAEQGRMDRAQRRNVEARTEAQQEQTKFRKATFADRVSQEKSKTLLDREAAAFNIKTHEDRLEAVALANEATEARIEQVNAQADIMQQTYRNVEDVDRKLALIDSLEGADEFNYGQRLEQARKRLDMTNAEYGSFLDLHGIPKTDYDPSVFTAIENLGASVARDQGQLQWFEQQRQLQADRIELEGLKAEAAQLHDMDMDGIENSIMLYNAYLAKFGPDDPRVKALAQNLSNKMRKQDFEVMKAAGDEKWIQVAQKNPAYAQFVELNKENPQEYTLDGATTNAYSLQFDAIANAVGPIEAAQTMAFDWTFDISDDKVGFWRKMTEQEKVDYATTVLVGPGLSNQDTGDIVEILTHGGASRKTRGFNRRTKGTDEPGRPRPSSVYEPAYPLGTVPGNDDWEDPTETLLNERDELP